MFTRIGQRIHRNKLLYGFCLIFLANLLLVGCMPTGTTDSFGKPKGKTPGRADTDAPPTPDERAFLLARSRFGHKHYTDAITELKNFLNTYPKSRYHNKAMELLGKTYVKTSDCTQALDTFKQLLKENPEMATGQLRWQMGECYFTLQDYKQALVEYQLVLDRYPKSVEQERLLFKIGLAAYHLGWLKQAQDSLLRVGGYNLKTKERIILFLTRGKITLKLQDYRTAWQASMEALKIVDKETSLEIIRMGEQVRTFIQTIITDHLPPEELELIVASYPANFPGGEAAWQLIQLQLQENSIEEALTTVNHFLNTFSTRYPNYQEAEELRSRLEEELRVDQHKIGVIVPFSGKLAPFGLRVLHGIELAIEEENRQRKKKIALIIKDSKGQSTLASAHMRELVEKERVIAVLGPVLSKATLAAAQVANELQTPLLTPAASADGIPETGPYVFRNSLTAQQQAESIARFAVEKMGLHRFAILAPDNSYGQELADIFAVILEIDLGGRLLDQLNYAPKDTDFRAQVEKLHTLPVQAIFMPDYYDKIVQLAPQIAFYSLEGEEGDLERLLDRWLPHRSEEEPLIPAKLLDWKPNQFFLSTSLPIKPKLLVPDEEQEEFPLIENFPPKIFLLGTHGWYSPQLLREGGKYINESVFASGFFAQNNTPLVKNFITQFKQRFWEEPDLLAAQAYDTTNILLTILRQGARTRTAVQENLSQLKGFVGLTGTGSFDEDGEMQKELTMVGVKRRRFRNLTGEEKWLHPFTEPAGEVLFTEKDLEALLPWDLYHLLAPLELFDSTQPIERQAETQFFD